MKKSKIVDENVERCLRARRKLERKYNTFEKFTAYLERLEKERPELQPAPSKSRQGRAINLKTSKRFSNARKGNSSKSAAKRS